MGQVLALRRAGSASVTPALAGFSGSLAGARAAESCSLVSKETQVTQLPGKASCRCISPVGEAPHTRPCGVCGPCIDRIRWDATALLRLEVSQSDRCLFLTATLKGDCWGKARRLHGRRYALSSEAGRARAARLQPSSLEGDRVYVPPSPSELLGLIYAASVQEALKRLRKNVGDRAYGGRSPGVDLRFFAVPEYGEARGRLHFHVMLMLAGPSASVVTHRLLKDAFGKKQSRRGARRAFDRSDKRYRIPAGFLHVQTVARSAGDAPARVARYCTKAVGYMLKDVGAVGKHWKSNRFGHGAVMAEMSNPDTDLFAVLQQAALSSRLPRLVVAGVSVRFGALSKTLVGHVFRMYERIARGAGLRYNPVEIVGSQEAWDYARSLFTDPLCGIALRSWTEGCRSILAECVENGSYPRKADASAVASFDALPKYPVQLRLGLEALPSAVGVISRHDFEPPF